MKQALFALVTLVAFASSAEPGPGPDPLRVSISGGAALRESVLTDGVLPVKYAGFGFAQLRFSGAWYFWKFLGVAADASAEWYGVAGKDAARQDTYTRAYGWRVSLGVGGRLAPVSAFSAELQLGYALGEVPVVSANKQGAPVFTPLFNHGPAATLVLALHPELPGSLMAWGRAAPWSLGTSGGPRGTRLGWFSAGVQLAVGRVNLGGLRWSVVAEYEFNWTTGNAPATGTEPEINAGQRAHRFNLGLRTGLGPPEVVKETEVVQRRPGSLKGRVVSAEGSPVWKANLTIGTAPDTASDADGRFSWPEVPAGDFPLTATAEGFKPETVNVRIEPEAEAQVVVTLKRPTGPGSLKGKVLLTGPDRPAAGAEVFIEGAAPVKCDSEGAFRATGIGPGPVSLKISFPGYEPADEVVQIPPEGESTVTLKLSNKKPNALLRGKVSARAGVLVSATVKVKQTGATVNVSADGRFLIELPGGTYDIIVEAPGFRSQTRTLEVGYGDQTIYHFELRPQAQ